MAIAHHCDSHCNGLAIATVWRPITQPRYTGSPSVRRVGGYGGDVQKKKHNGKENVVRTHLQSTHCAHTTHCTAHTVHMFLSLAKLPLRTNQTRQLARICFARKSVHGTEVLVCVHAKAMPTGSGTPYPETPAAFLHMDGWYPCAEQGPQETRVVESQTEGAPRFTCTA